MTTNWSTGASTVGRPNACTCTTVSTCAPDAWTACATTSAARWNENSEGGETVVNRSREKLIEEQLLMGCTDEECRKNTLAPIQLIRDIRKRMRVEGRDVEPDMGPDF